MLRRKAWALAEQLGLAETHDAEYVALTQLQADALVTRTTSWPAACKGSSPQRRSRRRERPEGEASWGDIRAHWPKRR